MVRHFARRSAIELRPESFDVLCVLVENAGRLAPKAASRSPPHFCKLAPRRARSFAVNAVTVIAVGLAFRSPAARPVKPAHAPAADRRRRHRQRDRLLMAEQLRSRQRLEAANRLADAVYFLESGIASVATVGRGGRQAEVALIGWEGMTGSSLLLGASHCLQTVTMLSAGRALRLAVPEFKRAIAESRSLLSGLLRYSQYVWAQITWTALASAQGSLEQRVALWLLMAHDRANCDEIEVTHELLATLLAVRRAGVTVAIQKFDSDGRRIIARLKADSPDNVALPRDLGWFERQLADLNVDRNHAFDGTAKG